MIAALELEERGIYWPNHVRSPLVARQLRGISANRRPWVAKITGSDQRYGLARRFLTARKDYRDASRSGRSGIKHWFFLEPGYYEVFAVLSSTRTRRYFVHSKAGQLREVEREEIDEWIRTGRDPSE